MVEYDKKDIPQSIETLMNIEKSKVFAQVRAFKTDRSLTPLECRQTLASVARLMLIGERLKEAEVNDQLLRGLIDLFKYDIPGLRQVVHWIIKEMPNLPELRIGEYRSLFPNKVAIDAGSSKEQNRIVKPNAIRALCRLFEPSDAQTLAKVIDPMIVDPESSVQSAALVSLYHTLSWGVSHLRPLQKQIQEAFSQPRSAGTWAWPEYHALGLDYRNRLASEMLAKDYIRFGDGGFRKTRKLQGPAAKIFFARFAAELAEKSNYRQGAIEFLKEQLDSFESIEYDPTVTGDKESFVLKRSMVALEAAKTICQMEDVDPGTLDQAVQKLVEMANNSHQVVKFAAMRALCSVVSTHPDTVRRHNDSMRKQMKNSNREIGSFATTTLLKTADEADVDSLMKEVGSLMSSASNDFKVVLVEAVTALCLKFPAKKKALAKFLGDYLKDEGSYEFKRAMVEGMFDLVKSVPETKKDVLPQLCEFIEDCEYPSLTIRVLHVIGTEGPTVEHPTPYIRSIYNRLVLENALVRAAAVTALSKFGVGQEEAELKRSVHVLLSRSLDDEDDEVRDRAALSLKLMDGKDKDSRELIRNDSMFSLAEFEDRLAFYVSTEDHSTFNEPFDLSLVPIVSRDKALSETRTKKLLGSTTTPKPPGRKGADDLALSVAATQKNYTREMKAIQELAEYGELLKSSPAIELIEPGIEYIVTLVIHFFKQHIVFQYNVTNDRENAVIEQVGVDFESAIEFLEEDCLLPINRLEKDQSGIVYVSFSFKNTERCVPNTDFSSKLLYILKDTRDPDDKGFTDNLRLNTFSLTLADFVMPAFTGSFDNVWEELRSHTKPENWVIPAIRIQEYVAKTLQAVPLQPLDATDVASSKFVHKLKLYGGTIYGGKVAAMVDIVLSTDTATGHNIQVQVQVRSDQGDVDEFVMKAMPMYKEQKKDEGGK